MSETACAQGDATAGTVGVVALIDPVASADGLRRGLADAARA